ncbi:fatty acid-binding protein [Lepeophtheirus salmonis]|uniref:Fatty acid-binding protein n=1 Tax=Lepeophtheirus salmonis TaxID=72036 RepID=C1BVN5_LEPSM|nr:fatty acid-binding protein-like [Lepeophtheirus salmonis]XP_040570611.1 fatty acid-binding protein-like [Lepeophtheirus salmonis]ACO13088.1 Fatty acid-binding protein [Lepeophtheirus salmonis]ADD38642.1 Fatty acid-binding protein [Lepeophtheirus salmonis]
MTPEYAGKYQRVSEENFESTLNELGLNFFLRKAALFSSPIMEISGKEDKWTIANSTLIKSIKMDFVFGVPFEEVSPDGRRCKTVVRREGLTRWITEQKALEEGKKDVVVIRDFSEDGKIINVMMTVGDVTSRQKFKKIS